MGRRFRVLVRGAEHWVISTRYEVARATRKTGLTAWAAATTAHAVGVEYVGARVDLDAVACGAVCHHSVSHDAGRLVAANVILGRKVGFPEQGRSRCGQDEAMLGGRQL